MFGAIFTAVGPGVSAPEGHICQVVAEGENVDFYEGRVKVGGTILNAFGCRIPFSVGGIRRIEHR